MKPLDGLPEMVFRKLTNELARVGDCRKIDNHGPEPPTMGTMVSTDGNKSMIPKWEQRPDFWRYGLGVLGKSTLSDD